MVNRKIRSMVIATMLVTCWFSIFNFSLPVAEATWWGDYGLPAPEYGFRNGSDLIPENIIIVGQRSYEGGSHYGGLDAEMESLGLNIWTYVTNAPIGGSWDCYGSQPFYMYFDAEFLDGKQLGLDIENDGSNGAIHIRATYNDRSGMDGLFDPSSITDFSNPVSGWTDDRWIQTYDDWLDGNTTGAIYDIDIVYIERVTDVYTLNLTNLTSETDTVALLFEVKDTHIGDYADVKLRSMNLTDPDTNDLILNWSFVDAGNSSIKDSSPWWTNRTGGNVEEDTYGYVDLSNTTAFWVNTTYLQEYEDESGTQQYEPDNSFVPEYVQLVEHQVSSVYSTWANWEIDLPYFNLTTGTDGFGNIDAFRGAQYMIMNFNKTWLHGKIFNVTGLYDTCSISYISLVDGDYDRTSTTDFPHYNYFNPKGNGVLDNYGTYNGAGNIDVDEVIDTSGASLSKVSIWVVLYDYSLTDHSNMSIELITVGNGTHYLWTFDPDGFWLADYVFPEGDRSPPNTMNQYGYIEYKNGYNGIYIHPDYLDESEEEEEEEEDDIISDEQIESVWDLLIGLFPLMMIMLLMGAMMGDKKKKGGKPTGGGGAGGQPQTQTYRFEHYKYE